MKKIIFIILLCFAWNLSSAPGRAEIYISNASEINIYEPLIKAVVYVESKGNRMAYNPRHHDTGPFQILPIRIKDYNQRTGSNYKLEDCYDYDLSRKIFLFYTKGRTFESVARAWNGGDRGMRRESTKKYWKQVKNYL